MVVSTHDVQQYELQKENAKVNKLPLPPPPVLKRYKTEDPTIEALGPILRDNPQVSFFLEMNYKDGLKA